MSGISSKAASSMDNNYKFNSSSELNNDLDIGLYETPLRGYDMQIGRFGAIDIYAETYHCYAGYAFVGNNPILYSDPSGAKKMLPGGGTGSNNGDPGDYHPSGGGGLDYSYHDITDWSASNGFCNDVKVSDAIYSLWNTIYGGSWNASTGNSFKFGSNQEGADYVNEHTITPQAVANYLQSQHPDWESINVSLSSGYSKRGEGFNYSAVYGTSTSEFYDDEQSGSNKDFVIGFFSIGKAESLLGGGGGGEKESEENGLMEKVFTLNAGLDATGTLIGLQSKIFEAPEKVLLKNVANETVLKTIGKITGVIGVIEHFNNFREKGDWLEGLKGATQLGIMIFGGEELELAYNLTDLGITVISNFFK